MRQVYAALLLAGCTGVGPEAPPPVPVNIQVSGTENLEAMMAELDRRGIPATVWLSGAEIDAACADVAEMVADGHEIAGKYLDEIVEETSGAVQRAEFEALADAGPRCAGDRLDGFRAKRFSANAATYDLVEEFGYDYLERSARDEFLSVYQLEPYRMAGRSYSILPMPVFVAWGEVASMCDNASEGTMTPEQLLTYEKAAIDHHLRSRDPLILEWHPSTTHPASEEGWWDVFLGVLDELEAQGKDVEFVTAEELVRRHAGCDC